MEGRDLRRLGAVKAGELLLNETHALMVSWNVEVDKHQEHRRIISVLYFLLLGAGTYTS